MNKLHKRVYSPTEEIVLVRHYLTEDIFAVHEYCDGTCPPFTVYVNERRPVTVRMSHVFGRQNETQMLRHMRRLGWLNNKEK